MSRFASLKIIQGDLPPSSRVTLFKSLLHCLTIFFPTSVDPVNDILFKFGFETNSSPALPSPMMTLSTPGGIPASIAVSAIIKAFKGVCSAGLTTQLQPAAKAGATLIINVPNGPFQGIIIPTAPTGSNDV